VYGCFGSWKTGLGSDEQAAEMSADLDMLREGSTAGDLPVAPAKHGQSGVKLRFGESGGLHRSPKTGPLHSRRIGSLIGSPMLSR